MIAAPEEQPFFARDPVAVEISFGSPPRQSRVTVAFRILLALPHVVVLFVLGWVAGLLVIVGWFAALFLGRLPRWIARYEMGVIAYSTRVNAYAYLLADKFPPFGFSAPDYSIAVEIGASRLSRLKVFFRLLLVIPVVIVVNIAGTGFLVLSPVIWLLTLVLGRMPLPLFGVAAAMLRYQARYYAYMSLVTDAYPRRLFGDRDSEWAPEGFRLQLSDGARWLMRVIVVLGITAVIFTPVVLRGPDPALVTAENRLEKATQTYVTTIQRCTTLRCFQTHARAWGEAFDAFASTLSRIPFPFDKEGLAYDLARDARKIGRALAVAANSRTAVEHDEALRAVQRLLPGFEAEARALLILR